MTDVELGKGRVVIEHADGMLRITIPAATQSFAVVILLFWLCFWPVGEVEAVRALFGGSEEGPLFTIAFLTGWTLAGIFVAYTLLWQLTGREIIELSSSTLRYHKQVSAFGRSREYAVGHVSNLRPVTPVYGYDAEGGKTNGLENGAISFDYGRSTHRFGLALEEADARHVVEAMCRRMKSLCPTGAIARGET